MGVLVRSAGCINDDAWAARLYPVLPGMSRYRYRKPTEEDKLADQGEWGVIFLALWFLLGMGSMILLIIGGGRESFLDDYKWTLIPYVVVFIWLVSRMTQLRKKLDDIREGRDG